MAKTKELTRVKGDVDEVVAQLGTMKVTTQEQAAEAAGFLRKIKQTGKVIHDVMDPEIKKLYDPYKTKTDERKGYLDQLAKAERAVKKMIGDYNAEQARIRAEAERKAREAEEEKRLAIAIETGHEEVLERSVAPVKAPEPEKLEGVYTATVWKWELTDIAKVKPEFLVLDEKKVGALVRSMKGDAQSILGEGIRVFSEQDVRARV